MSQSTKIGTYQTEIKTGTQQGMQVSVSGAGATATLSGPMTVKGIVIDHSRTYKEMVSKYSIEGGVSGFWDFIGAHVNASTEKTDIEQSLKEITKQSAVEGTFDIDIEVEGTIPGFSVSAMAAYVYLHVKTDSGQTYDLISSGDPSRDTGAVTSAGNTDGISTKANRTSYVGS